MLSGLEEICQPAEAPEDREAVMALLKDRQNFRDWPVILGCRSSDGYKPGHMAYRSDRVKFLHDGGTEPFMTTGIRLVLEKKNDNKPKPNES